MKSNAFDLIFFLLSLWLCFADVFGYGGHPRRHKPPGHWGSHERDEDDDKDRDDDDDDDDHESFWNAVGGMVILGFLVCGLISLVTWLFCICYRKTHRIRIRDSVAINMSSRGSDPPVWSALLYYKKELAGYGFGSFSKGFTQVSPSQLVRSRPQANHTDGARWSSGMVSGKHVFEITWAWGHRGSHATIGVGTAQAPIQKKGACPLVGGCGQTWGLDIVTRKTLHNGKFLAACPTDGSYVPDKFLMYVDIDNATVGFGNEVTYWGQVINNLPTNSSSPLYVMIGSCKPDAEIGVTYKGSDGGEFATIASTYALPPVFGHDNRPRPPPYFEASAPKDRPSSAGSQIINVEGLRPTTKEEADNNDQPPPYCSPPPGYQPYE